MTIEPILQLRSINFCWNNHSLGQSTANQALTDINLEVNCGEIYGLLGASGCGKTTLLRLILGRLTARSGSITMFGRSVDTTSNRPVPSEVGYMPQDIVLYSEFTPIEMLTYFGRLYHLTTEQISERIEFILRLLDLDAYLLSGITTVETTSSSMSSQIISKLSGGQQRRISLAIALLHQPRLLILDEPTVGVDPLLREIIWTHLRELTTTKHKVTVLLTTHYIEEARNAQTIGFLRGGRLLAQDSPQRLLEQFQAKTMEQVFLKLCLSTELNAQNKSNVDCREVVVKQESANGKTFPNGTYKTIDKQETCHQVTIQNGSNWNDRLADINNNNNNGNSNSPHRLCWSHLCTLMSKNVRQLRRNQALLIFFILLPAIEIALIMMCIGREIEHIPIAVFNGEATRNDSSNRNTDLSALFLSSIPENAFDLKYYQSEAEAVEAVRANKALGLLQFSERFSSALRARFSNFAFEPDVMDSSGSTRSLSSLLNESSVFVRLDMSNQLIGLQVQRQLLNAFLNFAQHLAAGLGLSNQTFRPPVAFGPPIYGIQSPAVVETFIAPGALIMIAFFATTIVTCHLLINEIRQALIERALIAGASSTEFLFSHIVIQSSILLVQLALMLLTAFRLFSMPYLGSLALSISLIVLQGLCGLMYGLMLSATCLDEIYATTLAIGTFFPSVIIGGIFWPVQSMPLALQYLSNCLPSTQSIDALRSILFRNWDLSYHSVAGAFLVSTGWMVVFLVCALRNFHRRI